MWVATTASGRTYSREAAGVYVSGEGYYHNAVCRSFPPSEIDNLSTDTGGVNWGKMNSLPVVDRPVVGEHFYVSSMGDAGWRISTPIVSVTE